jgi:hypothetical protein
MTTSSTAWPFPHRHRDRMLTGEQTRTPTPSKRLNLRLACRDLLLGSSKAAVLSDRRACSRTVPKGQILHPKGFDFERKQIP